MHLLWIRCGTPCGLPPPFHRRDVLLFFYFVFFFRRCFSCLLGWQYLPFLWMRTSNSGLFCFILPLVSELPVGTAVPSSRRPNLLPLLLLFFVSSSSCNLLPVFSGNEEGKGGNGLCVSFWLKGSKFYSGSSLVLTSLLSTQVFSNSPQLLAVHVFSGLSHLQMFLSKNRPGQRMKFSF